MARDHNTFRILAVMSSGRPGLLPEVWRGYVDLDEARACARGALRDPRVLGVAIVDDYNGPLRLVEWIAPETSGPSVTEGRAVRSVIETMQRAAAASADSSS